jgi:alkanesulfonate monooxygenase SsuD/methylene tetrahydromethanopterin reductase-like flavin-dependent oxidoreductase (luciferase family)
LNFLTRTADEVARYWELVDHPDAALETFNAHVETPLAGITQHVVIRETEREAMATARRAWPVFQRNWAATSLRMPDGRTGRANEDFDAVLAEHARLLIGTPQTVRDYVESALERLRGRPSFYFAPAFQWGDLSYEESLESMRLFANEVMPAFDAAADAPAGA